MQSTYRVQGMTCGHCVEAVSREVTKLAGVTDVLVDLDSGDVTITSTDGLELADVQAAVEEAGYELTAMAPQPTELEYSQICPRCGDEFSGPDRDSVADLVVAHARDAHRHDLDRHVVLAHLEGVRPDDLDG